MPRFEPFAGIRYDQAALTGMGIALDDVIAPPYDVIDEAERVALASRSELNSVRLELPVDEGGVDRYHRAQQLFTEWQASGTLRRDRPAFYAYRMSYADHLGHRRQSTGVIGALEVSEPGTGDVMPHERTMPKPKGDRLDLLRACRANLSPVWGLSLAKGLTDVLSEATDTSPAGSATDADGVGHELWLVERPDFLEAVKSLVAEAPVVIADGHHRYETALAYRDESRAAGQPDADAAEMVMAFVVELSPEQLAVRPIHRLLSALPGGFDLPEALSSAFELRAAARRDEGILLEMEGARSLGLLTREGAWLLTPKASTVAAAEDELDSSILEVASRNLPHHELTYEPDFHVAASAVASGQADAAVILRPAAVEQIASSAHGGRRMPPKTTYFYPKPRTGMVFRPLIN